MTDSPTTPAQERHCGLEHEGRVCARVAGHPDMHQAADGVVFLIRRREQPVEAGGEAHPHWYVDNGTGACVYAYLVPGWGFRPCRMPRAAEVHEIDAPRPLPSRAAMSDKPDACAKCGERAAAHPEDGGRYHKFVEGMLDARDRADASSRALQETRAALERLVIDANRLCDRQLGGTYEADCRRSLDVARAALALTTLPAREASGEEDVVK